MCMIIADVVSKFWLSLSSDFERSRRGPSKVGLWDSNQLLDTGTLDQNPTSWFTSWRVLDVILFHKQYIVISCGKPNEAIWDGMMG